MIKFYTLLFSFTLLCMFSTPSSFAQTAPKFSDADSAYQNAKKGILWSLSNIRAKKSRMENRLIADDRLIAQVKTTKEINGISITSTGYAGSTEVSLTIYRSLAELLAEGYLEKNSPLLREDE